MVEIRSYDGSAEELREFVVSVWRGSYGGRMAFPLWTPDYFRWQLGVDRDVPRDHLVVAYDGGRLVGAILGFPARFRTPLGERAGTQGSWLSVDKEYRRQGLATALRQELRRRHAELGLSFQIGYGYFGSRHSLGPAFWKSQRELGTTFLRRAGFWARVLRPLRAAAWNVVPWESLLTRTLGWLALPPWEPAGKLRYRPFVPEDTPACVQLIADSTRQCGFGLLWDEASLGAHLSGGGVARTMIAEREGVPVGFVNWHVLPFLGRTEESIAVLDLIALGGLGPWAQWQALNAALAWMKRDGAALVLKLAIGDYPLWPLVSTGFVPRLPDSYIMVTWSGEPESFPVPSRLHLLWR